MTHAYASRQTQADSRADVIAVRRKAERRSKADAPFYVLSADRINQLQAIRRAMPGISVDTQANRVLSALEKVGPLTTHDIRQHLDVVHPPGRVHTLRKEGQNIAVEWVRQATACGAWHRFGRYALLRRDCN